MSDKLDRSLDELLDERKSTNRGRRGGGGNGGGGNNSGGGSNRPNRRQDRDRQDSYPRDGVRKSYSRDEPRNIDSEWVHDKYEDQERRNAPAPRRRREPAGTSSSDVQGTRLRVENIHYELTEKELEELFKKIGPVAKFNLCYDRAGRSEGVAFVTYQHRDDATTAIQEFDGANANGQPIRLTLLPGDGNRRNRNPFDTAVMPSRSLADRITAPDDRDRSLSPVRRLEEEAARKGIDRYIPGGSNNRSRSPIRQRRAGGRRPGARRDNPRDSPRDQEGRGGQRSGTRTRKTQEELDAEMDDYFTGGQAAQPAAAAAPNDEHHDDIDMIE